MISTSSAHATSRERGEARIGCTRLDTSVPPRQTLTTREFLGGDSGRVIPDPIPNSVVKPSNVDGTARVTLWESRTLPGSYSESPRMVISHAGAFAFRSPVSRACVKRDAAACARSRVVAREALRGDAEDVGEALANAQTPA